MFGHEARHERDEARRDLEVERRLEALECANRRIEHAIRLLARHVIRDEEVLAAFIRAVEHPALAPAGLTVTVVA